jgi:hypothetical protein
MSKMYGLYSVDPQNTKDQIVHAFSFDINTLLSMKLQKVNIKEQKYYIAKPIKVYKYEKPSEDQGGYLKEIENEKDYSLKQGEMEEENNEKCYGYNYDNKKTDMIDQVIIIMSNKNRTHLRMKLQECNISHNPIILDMYYEEGILNT